jgi:hypothetical protein
MGRGLRGGGSACRLAGGRLAIAVDTAGSAPGEDFRVCLTRRQGLNRFRKALQFPRRRRDVDGEPGLRPTDDPAFDAPETVEVGHDPLTDCSGGTSVDADPNRGNILRLARKLASVRQHAASPQYQRHAGMAATLCARGRLQVPVAGGTFELRLNVHLFL